MAASGWLVAELADGSTQAYARAVFYAAFAIWAGGELVSGANWFRRALGAAGLIYVALEVATLMAA